ncbi:hypothetical protein COEREDRAFT_78837, partial [Coemansia reversa NRRL 1564]
MEASVRSSHHGSLSLVFKRIPLWNIITAWHPIHKQTYQLPCKPIYHCAKQSLIASLCCQAPLASIVLANSYSQEILCCSSAQLSSPL